jgi:ATP-dependent Lon protease
MYLWFVQQAIAKAIEEKISGDQRRYLLNEQLKAIKKVLYKFTNANIWYMHLEPYVHAKCEI